MHFLIDFEGLPYNTYTTVSGVIVRLCLMLNLLFFITTRSTVL